MSLYEELKQIIKDREQGKLRECRDADGVKTFQAQGAARELAHLIAEMEQLEHPEKAGED